MVSPFSHICTISCRQPATHKKIANPTISTSATASNPQTATLCHHSGIAYTSKESVNLGPLDRR